MLKKFLLLFLRVWRAPSVVVLRRTINRLDLFLYDIARFYFENILHKEIVASSGYPWT